MSEKELIREDGEGVTTLTLNRPDAYNALSLELMTALIEQLKMIAVDQSLRVVVIKGAGRGFCAGHDLRQMISASAEAYYQKTFETCAELMQSIVALPIPVIAQVHGVATAAGCQLVASCDLAVASSSSRFATPGVNIGLFCSTPMVALTRSIAPKHAMELLLSGDLINAQRAEMMGLINWSVEADELDSFTERLATTIASKSRYTLVLGKKAFHQQKSLPLEEAYEYCSGVMTDNIQADDAQEGIDAFLTKRQPVWKHS